MLSSRERESVRQRAYAPEHLAEYVAAVSGAEPHLLGPWLCYRCCEHLIFVGYPLDPDAGPAREAYALACQRFKPASAAIIAAESWLSGPTVEALPEDDYFRLALPAAPPRGKVANMVRRAGREMRVGRARFGAEHADLAQRFAQGRGLDAAQRRIFASIPRYLELCPHAALLEARRDGRLAAFTVADLGPGDWGFYLFHVRAEQDAAPGTSDLLLAEMLAQAQGQRNLNLGLGINPGNRRFKEKWGGRPFLHCAAALEQRRVGVLAALSRLLAP